MFGRIRHPRPLVLVLLVLATTWSCSGGTPQEETAALCEDLGHLAATVELIATPPTDADVGDLRGATEKLDPTIHEAERAGVVEDADSEAFRDDQQALLEALEGFGDDAPAADLPPETVAAAATLVGRYAHLMTTLDCPALAGG